MFIANIATVVGYLMTFQDLLPIDYTDKIFRIYKPVVLATQSLNEFNLARLPIFRRLYKLLVAFGGSHA